MNTKTHTLNRRSRLFAASLALVGMLGLHQVASAADTLIEAEKMQFNSSQAATFKDRAAHSGYGLSLWTNTTATHTLTTTGLSGVQIRVKGTQCNGAPKFTVRLDGQTILADSADSTSWKTIGGSANVAAGLHKLTVSFDNDYRQSRSCDRNLKVDYVLLQEGVAAPELELPLPTASPTASPTSSPTPEPAPTASPSPSPAPSPTPVPDPASLNNPLSGATLYVNPNSAAKKTADSWRSSRPKDAAHMDKLANRSDADWFGGWNSPISDAVDKRVDTITKAGALPVLVAYNIPQRDCGQYSAGGSSSSETYRTWIDGYASGIGNRKAIVILEPDALAMMNCLSDADKERRLDLLRYAVNTFEANPGTSVYLDGGHSGWHSAAEMGTRLKRAGIEQAQGFVLNVSNYRATSDETTYGKAVSEQVGGKHFVIDTSRNGLGPNGSEWCNPDGRALGNSPSADTGNPLIDAYLWVKVPGESDGNCNGGPNAGQFWADYALGLAQRAAY